MTTTAVSYNVNFYILSINYQTRIADILTCSNSVNVKASFCVFTLQA